MYANFEIQDKIHRYISRKSDDGSKSWLQKATSHLRMCSTLREPEWVMLLGKWLCASVWASMNWGGAYLETTVGVLMGCAAEQEAAWDDVLSIRAIGNVLRLVGQVWELTAETVCVVVSLWAWLFWSVQPVADTQGKRQDRLACPDSLTFCVPPPQPCGPCQEVSLPI